MASKVLKTTKRAMKSTDQTTYTTQTHVFQILNITNTICGENCESLWVNLSL